MILLSLNPFEFRGGIYLEGANKHVGWDVVLIPLNSGLVFTCKGKGSSTCC